MIDALLFVWRRNGKRAQDLFANIPDARLAEQPHGITNHPAWCLAHLNLYHPVLVSLARGETIADPALLPEAARVGNGSKPVADVAAYAPRVELIECFTQGHAAVEAALAAADESVLARAPDLERWKTAFGTTGTVLAYLMLYHESHHLAEISSWKKAAGIPVMP